MEGVVGWESTPSLTYSLVIIKCVQKKKTIKRQLSTLSGEFFTYTVMPFGLKNAPVVFSQIMVQAFQDFIHNFLKKTRLERGRRKMAIKTVQLFMTITTTILLTGVWGFKQSEIALFASSILTALGVAFFAQWSILSNISSSILIFFNHPVKLGDYVKVLHKVLPKIVLN